MVTAMHSRADLAIAFGRKETLGGHGARGVVLVDETGEEERRLAKLIFGFLPDIDRSASSKGTPHSSQGR